MSKEEFITALKELNIHLTEEQIFKLEQYYNLLIEWNEKINLTAITEKKEVYLKHFYDSITLYKVIDLNQELKLCDIGTGAGFPGIVLKIVFPTLKITLVDSLNKRIQFLNIVIDQLQLENIKTIHARMEEYALTHEEEYDIVTARAVAHLSNLLEYSAKTVKKNGFLIFMKGDLTEELQEATIAIEKLKLEVCNVEHFILPFENSNRTIIKLQKKEKTPAKYPRKYSEIKKKRL